ncbi:MAG: bifunctional nicotinamidase/pyrazinamidase [Alphaproteobacteria bacterium]|nr:bifunctional nicotinamidase/pyrazinamidase [Alphaproteobacteria bacterium]MCY4495728.1 bifunctional nicotinamidase/pyrazinamidase [Rhodospirillaceae bacterium]
MTTPTINHDTDTLVVIDVQNDFCPGGALEVPNGDEVVAPINGLMERFRHVLLTQDWHPIDHISFASMHEGRNPFEVIQVDYGPQVLWPNHCVQGTSGAEFHAGLNVDSAELVIRKGYRQTIDSYSALFENDRSTSTGLAGYLRDRGFERLFMAGLATDYCVAYSALDGRREGFEIIVIDDACRGIDLEGSVEAAWQQMTDAGVERIDSRELAG